MKRVIECIVHAFVNFDASSPLNSKKQTPLIKQLQKAGYELNEEKVASHELPISNRNSRFYAMSEEKKLNIDCRAFLMYIEQVGIITPVVREAILNQVFEIDKSELSLDQLKWLTIFVLSRYLTTEDIDTSWLEDVILNYHKTDDVVN